MSRALFIGLSWFLVALFATDLAAVEPDEVLSDPALEERAREVSRDLRCVVCKSQNIDDSDAPLAKDLRLLVRERITAGDTNEEAKAYIADIYGDYVLLKPPLRGGALLLWGAPLALLVFAGAAFFYRARTHTAVDVPQQLSLEEEDRIRVLLEDDESDST